MPPSYFPPIPLRRRHPPYRRSVIRRDLRRDLGHAGFPTDFRRWERTRRRRRQPLDELAQFSSRGWPAVRLLLRSVPLRSEVTRSFLLDVYDDDDEAEDGR